VHATCWQLNCVFSFLSFLAVNVLVTCTSLVNTPEALLVKRPIELEQKSVPAVWSNVHKVRSPEAPGGKPAPVTVMVDPLTMLLPSLGETLSVTLVFPNGRDSGAAMAAPIVPTVKAMAMANAARWRGTRCLMRTTDLRGCGA